MSLNSLNYLWVKPYPDHTSDLSGIDMVLPPVPLPYQQNIIDTVTSNPNWRVNLWMEPDERPFAAKYKPSLFTSCGVVIRFLDEIRTFRTDAYLNLDGIDRKSFLHTDYLFWKWIDTLKILILKQTLKGANISIFTDLDIADLRLDSPEIMRPLTKHGLVVGTDPKQFTLEEWRKYEVRLFENQFIGFTKDRKFDLHCLYRETTNYATDQLPKWGHENGFWPLNDWVRSLAEKSEEPRRFEEEIAYYPKYIEV